MATSLCSGSITFIDQALESRSLFGWSDHNWCPDKVLSDLQLNFTIFTLEDHKWKWLDKGWIRSIMGSLWPSKSWLCRGAGRNASPCRPLQNHISRLCRLPQVARQSQLLRGVFPVLFHPLPAPVWADDVDNRVNFGMDIGQRVCVCLPPGYLYAMTPSHSHTLLCFPPQERREDSSSRATWWLWWQAGSQGPVTLTLWGRSASRNNWTWVYYSVEAPKHINVTTTTTLNKIKTTVINRLRY